MGEVNDFMDDMQMAETHLEREGAFYSGTYSEHIAGKYKMSKEQYNNLYSKQKGQCAICGIHQSELERRLDIDHNHKTEEVRGLLCMHCNLLVGKVEAGRIKKKILLEKVNAYLDR